MLFRSNYHCPGWWEPGPALSFYVNRDKWNALPKGYQAALEADGTKPWVKIYSNLHLGTCYLMTGKADQAVDHFKKASADKAHLIYPRAQIGLGRAYAAAKRWSDASRVLKGVSEGRFGFWRDRATLALGI